MTATEPARRPSWVVSGLPNPAFTVGWFHPMVYVAAELAEWLTSDELAAVLAHERAHLGRRDPLRLSVLRFLGRTLFWLPALHRTETASGHRFPKTYGYDQIVAIVASTEEVAP